jgi:adenylate cyclase
LTTRGGDDISTMTTLGDPSTMQSGLTAQPRRQLLVQPSLNKSSIGSGDHEEATFCFVDIAGYTALTDSHGALAAADLIEVFNELIRSAVESMGQIQELTGDCAFLVFPNPVLATNSLAALYRSVADRKDFPVVRAGLHHGSALRRGDRYFGSTVNIAARTAAQAIGGEILCTKGVAEDLMQVAVPGIEVQHRGLTSLRNLPHPLDLYAIVLSSISRQYAIDPVCQMQVDAMNPAGVRCLDGRTYWFCSTSCAEKFSRRPFFYV